MLEKMENSKKILLKKFIDKYLMIQQDFDQESTYEYNYIIFNLFLSSIYGDIEKELIEDFIFTNHVFSDYSFGKLCERLDAVENLRHPLDFNCICNDSYQ